MLRYVLAIVVLAQCVYGAPQVYATAVNVADVPRTPDNGRLVNNYVTDGLYEIFDGGIRNIHTLTAQLVSSDLANQPDTYSQAVGIAQAIALTGTSAAGIAGDACASANLINAYANGQNVRQAVRNYLNTVYNNIDNIVVAVNNPAALSNLSGPRGNCAGGGRRYNFEGAWDKILERANPFQIGLLNEQYCTARRLYTASNVENNNIAAAITAASIEPIAQIFCQTIRPVANFLRVVVAGGNPASSAAAAKLAIKNAASSL